MGPWYYEVVSFDGDYVNLRRTDIESDELNPVALALLPPEIDVGSKLKCEYFQQKAFCRITTKSRPSGRLFCVF